MRVGRSLRGARAAVFAAACVGVSAAGHVWMSGAAIPAWTLLVALLAVYACAYAIAGRRRGFASIAALMLAGELGLHTLFDLGQRASGAMTSPMSSMPGMPNMPEMPSMPRIVMSHPVPASAWLCGGGTPAAGSSRLMTWMSAHGSLGMIAVHAAAGLLCAWWLWRGEAACFHLLDQLGQLALPLLVLAWPDAPAAPPFTARVTVVADERVPAGRRLFENALVRRGPPAGAFCM
jgi:hypothetical protein